MKLEILSFDGDLFKSDDVVSINVMTKSWEITVLDDHMPMITSINPGVLIVSYHASKEDTKLTTQEFAVGRWVLEVGNHTGKILIDMLVSAENLDREKAELAKQDALKMMEKYKGSKDKIDMEKFIEAEDMLFKSLAQLKLWNVR